MSKHSLTEKQRQQRQEWVTNTVGQTAKAEVHTTQFECEVVRLGLSPDQYVTSEELRKWVSKFKDKFYVPESLLCKMGVNTIYDGEPAVFSVVKGTVIPEPLPLQDTEELPS